MNPLVIIEQRICDVLGIRGRRGGAAQLERELCKLQREHGLAPSEVALRVAEEPWLLRRLAGCLTVDESFFFRHPEHFEPLLAAFAEHTRLSPERPFVVWSAGCASGEEPYSIAIAVLRACGESALTRLSILATDVSESSLAKAQRAVYGAWAFRGTDAALRARFFEPVRGGEQRLLPIVRGAVSFRHLSLDQQLAELRAESVDALFFRNVAIYMTPDTLARFYEGAARVLRTGGLLATGPADPIPQLASLGRMRVEKGLLYRKGQPAPRANGALPSTSPLPLPKAPARRPSQEAAPSAVDLTGPSALVLAEQLAGRGQHEAAIRALDSEAARAGKSAPLLGLRGRIRFAAGDNLRSVDDLRAALFLDPSQTLLRFYYALGLEALQQHHACRAQLREVLRALESVHEGHLFADGETTAASLNRAASELLRCVE